MFVKSRRYNLNCNKILCFLDPRYRSLSSKETTMKEHIRLKLENILESNASEPTSNETENSRKKDTAWSYLFGTKEEIVSTNENNLVTKELEEYLKENNGRINYKSIKMVARK